MAAFMAPTENSVSDKKTSFMNAKLNCRYLDQQLKFQVVSMNRYMMTTSAARRAKLPYGYSESMISSSVSSTTVGGIYLPLIILMEPRTTRTDPCMFHTVYLNSKYDDWIKTDKLRPGSVVCVTEYVRRGQPVRDVRCPYTEILEWELMPLDSVWEYDLFVLTDMLCKSTSVQLPVRGMIKLETWFDKVPCWHQENLDAMENTVKECNEDYLNNLQSDLVKIADVAGRWATDPSKFGPLLVRVVKKTLIKYYVPLNEAKKFPTSSMYSVADNSGTCSLILWDNANTRDSYAKIHMGSVLLVRNYRVKKGMVARFSNERHRLKNYQIELSVDGNPRGKNPQNLQEADVMLVEPNILDRFDLPEEQYNFIKFKCLRDLVPSAFVDISGIVVGISRLYRVSALKENSIGRFFVFRFVEVYDIRNDRSHQIEVFINDQLFVSPTGCRNQSGLQHYPVAIVKEFELLETTILNEDRLPPIWIGGLNWFTWACLTEEHVHKVIRGNHNLTGESMNSNFQNLPYFECRSFGFNGTVALIEYCTLINIRLKFPSSDIYRTEKTTKQAHVVFKIPDLDRLMLQREIIGGSQPNLLTFPVRGFTDAADVMRESLRFPPTTILEVLQCHRKNHVIMSDDFTCQHFFRILLLSEDEHCALWSIFMPPPPLVTEELPTTLIDLLQLKYKLNGVSGGSLARCDLNLSSDYLESLKHTGRNILNSNFTFMLQAYKNRSDDVEVSFCYLSHLF